MNCSEVDGFYAALTRALPAAPDWRIGNRPGEQRASLPVSVNGKLSDDVSLVLTVRLVDPKYLIAVLIDGQRCFSRLCMGPGHFDRRARTQCDEPHFHSWQGNRPKGNSIPRELQNYAVLPTEAWARDAGFAWFLEQNSIESPDWMPPQWPENQGFV